LATESTAQAVHSTASDTVASFFWTVGDDTGSGPESAIFRGATLAPTFALGVAGSVDTSSSVSRSPTLETLASTDSAVVGWIEFVGSSPSEVRLAVVTDYLSPGVDYRYTLSGLVQPATPDLAIVADTTLLVVWSAFSPPDVSARRFDLTLTPLGEEFLVSTTLGASTVPRVAASGTSFLVAWQEEGEGVMLAAVDAADGTVDVVAEPLAGGTALRPTLAADLAGGFAVAYETDTGVEVQRVSAAGIPAGAPLAFAGGTRPEITTIPEGGLVLAYDHAGIIHLARLGCSP